METPAAAVQRYRNSFSIENILSKPVTNSNLLVEDVKLKYNLSERVPHANADKNHNPLSGSPNSEVRSSSPESSFNEDTLDDAKSDITSEDDHGEFKILSQDGDFFTVGNQFCRGFKG